MNAEADAIKVAALRELLPATGAGIYLDTATRGPLPAEAAAAMREADDWELRVGRVWEGRDEDVAQRTEEARAVVAALLGADPASVALAPGFAGATAVLGELFRATRNKPLQIDFHVHPRTGAIQRPRPRGQQAVVMDVSRSVGAMPVTVESLDVDALIFAADRWLLGPEHVFGLWVRDQTVPEAEVALSRSALIGCARSVGWLEMYVGLDWIYERTAILAGRLHESLLATEGVEVVTPRDALVAIVSFRMPRWPAAEAADELSRRVHAMVRPSSHDAKTIVASVGWFNTESELDRFAEAVAELASYTPDTLPRRPSLIVLADT